jgi:pyruvate dehydrogenase E2 component (dihydrolipoamide acetyltransferase)
MNGIERPGGSESAKGGVERIELDRAGQTIARRMAESKATAPHLYLRAEVDMSRAVAVRAAFRQTVAGGEPVPTLNDMVVKAVALALRNHPRANGAYRDGGFELYSRINVGIVVAAGDFFAIPTIADADRCTLGEIATESHRLAARVRKGEITPPELAGGTFTVSNLGMFGVRSFDPVINGGQAAILGVGEVSERAVVSGGAVTSAHMMEAGLACDHRILYGTVAAAFLAEIKTNLEQPDLLA